MSLLSLILKLLGIFIPTGNTHSTKYTSVPGDGGRNEVFVVGMAGGVVVLDSDIATRGNTYLCTKRLARVFNSPRFGLPYSTAH